MENETFNILLTVPQRLNEKLCAEAEKKSGRDKRISFTCLRKIFQQPIKKPPDSGKKENGK